MFVVGGFRDGSLFLLLSILYDFDLSWTNERKRSILNHLRDSYCVLSRIPKYLLDALGFLLFTKRSVNARLKIVDIDELFI